MLVVVCRIVVNNPSLTIRGQSEHRRDVYATTFSSPTLDALAPNHYGIAEWLSMWAIPPSGRVGANGRDG